MGLALFAAGVSVAQTQPGPPPIASPSQQAAPVVEQPRTVAPLGAEQRERDDKAAFGDQLLIFASLLVAVGAFLAIAFAFQVFYLGLGLRTMRRDSERADRNVTAAQRAFLYLSELRWSGEGGNIRISPVWSNSGTTPTRRLRIATNWKASHGELRPDFDISYAQPPENLFLGPRSTAEFGTVVVPTRDVQAAAEGRLHLYVWGRATYEDMFQGTTPHFFEFCHRVEIIGETPDRMAVSFTQFGLSNGSDEDSRETADASV